MLSIYGVNVVNINLEHLIKKIIQDMFHLILIYIYISLYLIY